MYGSASFVTGSILKGLLDNTVNCGNCQLSSPAPSICLFLVAYCTRLPYKALQDALTYPRRLSHPPVEDAQANSLLCVIAFAVSDIAPSNPLSVCRCSTITFDSHAMLYSHVFMCSENH